MTASFTKNLPKSVSALRNYSFKKFSADLLAGLTVGLVALPLAMAFAISSGVLPQSGLYCAIFAGFIISALGGSTTQIGGPTGAFVVVVAGIIAKHGMDGLFMCTMMAGAFLVLLGATGLGTAVRFIPRPVIIGFTNGIAVLIASTQLRDFFGLRISHPSGEFGPRILSVVQHMDSLSLAATIIGTVTLLTVILCTRYLKRIPGPIVAMLLGTAVCWIFHLPVETIESRFGGIPSGLPAFAIPHFRVDLIPVLLSSAITVAMLGSIESLLSAVVSDRMSGDKHNPNVELVAQGIANIVSPLFGGLPATGAIARTATNIRAGARTPVAGMIHALTLLLIILFAAPLAKHIPLAVLAGILLVVSYNMGEWREIGSILHLSKADVSVWLITFMLTVFADLTVAVEAGMILAALLYIRKVTTTTTVSEVTPEYIQQGHAHILQHKEIPSGVSIFRIHGPFLFGSTDKLEEIESRLDELGPVVLVRLRNMTAIDATGISALEDLADLLHSSGRHLIVCGMREQPLRLMQQAKFSRHIGKGNILPTFEEALTRARLILSRHRAKKGIAQIRVLYSLDKETANQAAQMVKAACAELEIRAAVHLIEIERPGEAARYRMRGSPTILVDGQDLFAAHAPDDYGLNQRDYASNDSASRLPTFEAVREALLEHVRLPAIRVSSRAV